MSSELDLLLVRAGTPKRVYGALADIELPAVEPPLWAALLAAWVREQGFTVGIIDTEVDASGPEAIASSIDSLKPLLVAFVVIGNNLSASTWHMGAAREYHSALKEISSVRTLFWGLHPSALPQRTLMEEGCDFVCEGEGFETLVDLLERLRRSQPIAGVRGLHWVDGDGGVASGPAAMLLADLDDLPTPAWDLLPMQAYRAHNWHCFQDLAHRQPYGVVYTSLGCAFDCSFCSLKRLFAGRRGVRYRSPERVIEDVRVLVEDYGVKNIKILDECFALRESHVVGLCDLIRERGYDLNLWAYSRVDTVNPPMLSAMRAAGMRWLAYGIESGSREALDGVQKGRYGEADIREAVGATQEAGIYVVGNYMFGLPGDDEGSMRATLDMSKELLCEYANFSVTMAYPGSALYGEALAAGTRLPERWTGYSQLSEDTLPLPTQQLTAEDVLRFRDAAFTAYHTDPAYLRMMQRRFGAEVVGHVKRMAAHPLTRTILSTSGG
jgi:radical SAM superfamily enzyme YgiQ (UPF0313 family)